MLKKIIVDIITMSRGGFEMALLLKSMELNQEATI
ncbi:hypothetical protein M892_02530 [Vibrio campbellii ATCC BAA-1116]|uniref:Uncharacterized protein n=1 Tax=Vibrio campbellii (strain ATCC BAA-1116) TaxID=2902295 RepID=A7MVU1_VIBC1|nr:hypothetical protein VIBHAR_02159 [Vibrio campbellii ATCC BAA-1116]AGU96074.1 hypothetical protein M892_02530 [Vibrio campbellii ATCC BAA-1116]